MLLTPRQTTERLGVHVDTLKTWRREHKGPPWIQLDGRQIRYDEDELNQWLQERTVRA